MEAKSIDKLLEEVAAWSNKHTSSLSDTAQEAFAGVPFRLQEALDKKDYKSAMDIAIGSCGLFASYVDQLQSGDLSSLMMPKRIGRETEERMKAQFLSPFSSVSWSFYHLFVGTAREFIKTMLGDNAMPIKSYNEIRDDGRYIVILPEIGGFKLVEGTYNGGKVIIAVAGGPRLVKAARNEKEAYAADLDDKRGILRQNLLPQSQIKFEDVAEGLFYSLSPSLKIN